MEREKLILDCKLYKAGKEGDLALVKRLHDEGAVISNNFINEILYSAVDYKPSWFTNSDYLGVLEYAVEKGGVDLSPSVFFNVIEENRLDILKLFCEKFPEISKKILFRSAFVGQPSNLDDMMSSAARYGNIDILTYLLEIKDKEAAEKEK